MKKKKSKLRKVLEEHASTMPPLEHSHPGERYDIMQSDVMDYLLDIPEIRQALWDQIRNTARDEVLIYDPEDGTWCGCDYDDR